MIDTSDLEWYMCIELKARMTVGELNDLLNRLEYINPKFYKAGTEDERIKVTKDGDLGLEMEGIIDKDMPEVLRILSEYALDVVEICHDVTRGVAFWKCYTAFTDDDLLDEFRHNATATGSPLMAWNQWKEESGFNKFVKEVYSDD